MLSNFFNTTAIAISLSTATGILMHDTRLDKATMTALSLPSMTAATDAAANQALKNGTPHTHVERVSFAQAVHDLKTQNPRVQPRSEDKKHTLPKRVMKGHHAFDNYNLPVV